MSNVCKPCKIDEAKVRYNLAKIHSRLVDGKCMCCGRIAKLNLDNCHNTSKYRSFTCTSCNVGLGHLGDSIEGLERALHYFPKADGRSDEGVAEETMGGKCVSEHNPA